MSCVLADQRLIHWRRASYMISAAVWMRSSLFWDITKRRLIFIDISGQPIGPAIQYQAVQRFFFGSLVLEDGAVRSSWNVGSRLPVNVGQRPERTDTSRLKTSAPSVFFLIRPERNLPYRPVHFRCTILGATEFKFSPETFRSLGRADIMCLYWFRFKKNAVVLCQVACTVQSCTRVEYTCLTHVSSDTCVYLIDFYYFFLADHADLLYQS